MSRFVDFIKNLKRLFSRRAGACDKRPELYVAWDYDSDYPVIGIDAAGDCIQPIGKGFDDREPFCFKVPLDEFDPDYFLMSK